MKFRTLLLASAAVMVAAPAFAGEDITAAFYTPAQGKFLSSTTLAKSRAKVDVAFAKFTQKGLNASEELTYGVTDNFAIFGTITNNFNTKVKLDERDWMSEKWKMYNNNHNFAYELGGKYTVEHNSVLAQAALSYMTWDPRSWYGKDGEDLKYSTNKWEKVLKGEVKLGYVLGCGLTPYTTLSVSDNVTHSAKDKTYSWFLGAHKMLDKVSLDGGVRYDFNSDDAEAWYLQAEVNYFVKDNITVGVFGDYYIGGAPQNFFDEFRVDRKDYNSYTLGLNVKVAF